MEDGVEKAQETALPREPRWIAGRGGKKMKQKALFLLGPSDSRSQPPGNWGTEER